ncbi:MAG: hypothetical protein A3E01_04400 [Gammaproteobacteria bacterium RIFCSPHIGHO2_12_FULL_63_22]|nr:MAG: hypothetical protein A3E01_04400 [Gammaproteobacteria bacterium RIFCSPHIGHO2_12_FULL_63_22]
MASAMFAMLGLSAGTAYGTDYHVLSPRQRVMARVLGLGSMVAAVAFAMLALGLAAWTLGLLLA